MTPDDFATLLTTLLKIYGPTLGVEEAAKVAKVPEGTIYALSSRGEFDAFKGQCGRRITLGTEAFAKYIFKMNGKAGGAEPPAY